MTSASVSAQNRRRTTGRFFGILAPLGAAAIGLTAGDPIPHQPQGISSTIYRLNTNRSGRFRIFETQHFNLKIDNELDATIFKIMPYTIRNRARH
jgi:hypothetical protein